MSTPNTSATPPPHVAAELARREEEVQTLLASVEANAQKGCELKQAYHKFYRTAYDERREAVEKGVELAAFQRAHGLPVTDGLEQASNVTELTWSR
jgi:hypothetical protein